MNTLAPIHGCEVLAAAQLIRRMLEPEKLDIHELAEEIQRAGANGCVAAQDYPRP